MHKIFKAARKCGYLKDVIEPLDSRDAKKIASNKIVYLCTGSQGEPMGALNRIANYSHQDVFIEKDDAVIFSSKIIPGNVRKHYNVHNKLLRDGIEVISEETEFVHVSGHPNRDDLKDMYSWVKPKSVIPVHGEHRHMIEHINFANERDVPNEKKRVCINLKFIPPISDALKSVSFRESVTTPTAPPAVKLNRLKGKNSYPISKRFSLIDSL